MCVEEAEQRERETVNVDGPRGGWHAAGRGGGGRVRRRLRGALVRARRLEHAQSGVVKRELSPLEAATPESTLPRPSTPPRTRRGVTRRGGYKPGGQGQGSHALPRN